jgi:hypothetical protein
MALEFAHGVVQWLAADAATTTYTVSGLPFQPKALRFTWVGIQSATDANSAAVSAHRGVGFAVSATQRRSCGTSSVDASAASNCGSVASNDCIACTTDSNGARNGLLDLNSITSDGFVLIVNDAAPANLSVSWEAWGGTDITVASVGDIAEPAATGNQDYTVTGFVAAATDQVVLLAGVRSIAALNTAEAGVSNLYAGCASSGSAGNNIVLSGAAADASATMVTRGYGLTNECLFTMDSAATTVSSRATMTQFGTNNFRLNWLNVGRTNRRSIFLAIKGGAWAAGGYTIDASTLNATATVSGLSFAPNGVSLLGRGDIQNTSPSLRTDDRMAFGCGSGPTSRRSLAMWDENGTANCEIDTTIQYDQVLAIPSAAGGLLSAFDIDAMLSDGFRIIVDVAGGAASEWQGYLTFGNASTPVSQTVSGLVEARGAMAAARGMLVEVRQGLAPARAALAEARQRLTQTRQPLNEATQGLAQGRTALLEARSAVAVIRAVLTEARGTTTTPVSQTVVTMVEARGAIVQSRTALVATRAGLAIARTSANEARGRAVQTTTPMVESRQALVTSRTTSVEARRGLSQTRLALLEARSAVAVIRALLTEARGSTTTPVSQTVSGMVEARGAIVQSRTALVATRAGLAIARTSANEARGRAVQTTTPLVEARQMLSQARTMAVEAKRGLSQTRLALLEARGYVAVVRASLVEARSTALPTSNVITFDVWFGRTLDLETDFSAPYTVEAQFATTIEHIVEF